MAAVAVLRAADHRGRFRQAWVRQEARLGRRQGDGNYNVCVWAEAQEVELGIQDALVSRRHAYLFFEGETLWLQDLGSAHGTFLNDQPLPTTESGHHGAAIALPTGTSRLRLGPRCVLEVEVVASPLGMQGPEWGRLSSRLTYPDLNMMCDIWRWSQPSLSTPSDVQPLVKLFECWLGISTEQQDQTRAAYRLALDAGERQQAKFADSMVEMARVLATPIKQDLAEVKQMLTLLVQELIA